MSKDLIFYFAYGSDMSFRQMQQRLIENEIILDETCRSSGKLTGWELRFDKAVPHHPEIGMACIHEHPGSIVEGILYQIPSRAMDIIDTYQDVAGGHYTRITLEVDLHGRGPVQAHAYVPVHDHIKPGLRPSRNHLYRLLAAEKFLSPEYFAKLKKTESLKVPVDDNGHPHAPRNEAKPDRPKFSAPRAKTPWPES